MKARAASPNSTCRLIRPIQRKQPMFEYKIELINTAKTKPLKIEAQLTALGQDGWELVSVVPDFDGEHILKAFLKRRTGDTT
ncbi:DUF4177 domain-containing protein [Pukyongiella litopenaei]|uniref:DUF4177 domain-containing protein n=2 Tax=Pukyongiella litopenaei TaxID=2605946 RepID=A0A5C2H5U1_9RHOB|nr:DUF4177 domain-containing protein [Pukyongiella litopenaei]